MRYLGIDYGSLRIGLALSDAAGTMGFPHSIIPNSAASIEAIAALIAKEQVSSIVLGESRSLSGADNPIMKAARAFGEKLTLRTGIRVQYESEVFTSAEARRAPRKEGKSRTPKKHRPVDDQAAALILTSYLSRVNHE